MDKKNKKNLIFYLSYLPLTGSIVANIMSIIFYFYQNKEFSAENLLRPLIYFVMFSVLGIGVGKYLDNNYKIKNKNLLLLFVAIFIIINIAKYYNVL